MKIEKIGVKLPFTFEAVLESAPETPKGRYRKLTPEERAEWRAAKAALKILKNNPWVGWDHEDGYYIREPRRWMEDE